MPLSGADGEIPYCWYEFYAATALKNRKLTPYTAKHKKLFQDIEEIFNQPADC